MTALRTTRPAPPRRRTGARRARLLGLTTFLGLAGCGGPGPEPADPRPATSRLPAPASERIGYDDQTRTLTLPDPPPPGGRWMVRLPNDPVPAPVGPDHRLPEGVDPGTTLVYYCRPGGQTSGAVSLAQIQAARELLASANRN